tara:strand:+ start:335 stop:1825 length:1491 start_codon:yes stop_codon:yes gene_type:complete
MNKILLINPSKWGRGVTSVWIPSHTSILRNLGYQVELFDCTFYSCWVSGVNNEVKYNTDNKQYKPTEYFSYIKYNENDIYTDLQKKIDDFNPDVIFWSAVSSHIHGEGEYVNIEYGYKLISKIKTNALKVTGGLQPTADSEMVFNKFKNIDILIRGESELVLSELVNNLKDNKSVYDIKGLSYISNGLVRNNNRQNIISDLDVIPPYDYSIFDEQIFYRPYNRKVLKAVDYELSRGCIYACDYCVETVLQNYYGFDEVNNGVLKNARKYLRNKSAKRVFEEIKTLHYDFGIELFRCQDTNFLTIEANMLKELSELFEKENLDIKLYIETRPEGINSKSIELLKKLRVDGVGLGVEMSTESFREDVLNRYANQNKIIKAFKLLKDANIKRTAYNIIGLPEQTEDMIIETIKFNQLLNPTNMTVAYYSPYIGTKVQKVSKDLDYFDDYEYMVDPMLRSVSKSTLVGMDILEFYKKHFVTFVREGLSKLDEYKNKEGLK